MSVLAMFIAFSLAFVLSNRHTSQDIMDMVYSMVAQGCPEEPDKLPGKTVFLTAFLFGFIILNAYAGKLIAFLTIHKESVPFNSLDEMLHKTSYTLTLPGGTVYVNFFKVCR